MEKDLKEALTKIKKLEAEIEFQKFHKERYLEMLPDNVCYDSCDTCSELYFEDTGELAHCPCKKKHLTSINPKP